MSREALMRKVSQHLTDQQKQSPLERLQDDLMKAKQARIAEVITLKIRNGGVKESELLPALKAKGLTLADVIDSDGSLVQADLSKNNINLIH